MNNPIVTVLMPVYNSAAYLDKAVQSILDQTHENFEFLIFDDGSSDGSVKKLINYAQTDSRIKFYQCSHSGYSAHLNEGIQLACGSFIARMDSDDYAYPQRLEKQLNYLQNHPDVLAVGTSVELMDEDGDSYSCVCGEMSHEELVKHYLQPQGGVGLLYHPSMMMRTEAVRLVGGYRTDFEPAEDMDLWLRLSEVGKLARMEDVLLKFRTHQTSISHRKMRVQHQNVERALHEAYARRNLPGKLSVGSPDEIEAVTSRLQFDSFLFMRSRLESALSYGFSKTAKKYAYRLLRKFPCHWYSWRVARAAFAGNYDHD